MSQRNQTTEDIYLLCKGKYLQFDWLGLSSFTTYKKNIFSCLIKSNPVKLEKVILPLTKVGVLWRWARTVIQLDETRRRESLDTNMFDKIDLMV